MRRDDTHTNQSDGSRTPEDRSRDVLIAAGVIAAAAALWALAIGVLDQGPTLAGRYPASPAARVERRPVLFVVRAAGSESDDVDRVAVPIASLDPTGVVRPPFEPASTGEARRAIVAAFAADYYAGGDPLSLLSGGAVAGAMRFVDAAGGAPVAAPFARVTSDAAGRADVLTTAADDLLAISDARYGASSSGARPLKASHTDAVELLARSVARERFPDAQVESVSVSRVRAADLDHSGTPELLASVLVRMRGEGRRERTVGMFIIGEPANGADTYRVSYARWIENPPEGDAFVFVDQVDLTSSPFDEVVVRADSGGASSYVVLERTNSGWFEAVATPSVSAR